MCGEHLLTASSLGRQFPFLSKNSVIPPCQRSRNSETLAAELRIMQSDNLEFKSKE